MNIYKYELKMNIKSIITWSVSITLFLILFMAFYPSMASDAELMNQLMANYPEELLKAFGMDGTLSLDSVFGFLAFTFVFVQLCIAIQSANYGFSILSIEERELTADFLMSKPVSRRRIIIGKFLAALTSLTITNAVVWFATFASIELFKDGHTYETENLVVMLSSIILFQLFFLSIGMLISMLTKKIKSVLSYSMALSFGMYIINAFGEVIGTDTLGLLTPFNHFEVGYILENGAYDMSKVVISLAVIVVSLVSSYYLYLKRNIHSV